MLANARLQSIILTADVPVAEAFYRDVLGLTVTDHSDGDVDEVVDALNGKGVVMEHFEHFCHQDNGVLVTPNGSRVAWFRDPDGNLLSVVKFVSVGTLT